MKKGGGGIVADASGVCFVAKDRNRKSRFDAGATVPITQTHTGESPVQKLNKQVTSGSNGKQANNHVLGQEVPPK